MKYLIFETLALAIAAAINIYWIYKIKKKVEKKENINPVELEDGRYALEKPEDKYMLGVDYDEIKDIINKKENI